MKKILFALLFVFAYSTHQISAQNQFCGPSPFLNGDKLIVPAVVVAPTPQFALSYKPSASANGPTWKESYGNDFSLKYAGHTMQFKKMNANEVKLVYVSGCDGDDEIELPSTVNEGGKVYKVTYLGTGSLRSIGSKAVVTYPQYLHTICSGAFLRCYFRKFEIPSSVKCIEANAFRDCKYLEKLYIHASVKSIGYCPVSYDDTFDNGNFKAINVDTANPNYKSVDGVLYNKSMTELIQVPYGYEKETFTIPSTVVSINREAFRFCRFILDVIIPSSVRYIYHSAFRDAYLRSMFLPSSVIEIGERAFGGNKFDCHNINAIYVMSPTPPKAPNNVFCVVSSFCYDPIIYVGKGHRSAFLSTEPWSRVSKVKEVEFVVK